MELPSAQQYLEIVAKKSGNLGLLADHHFLLRNDNQYFYELGRNTIVFKTSRNSNFYAARFFLNDDPELFRRYHDVQNYLESKKLFWKLPFEFLDNGLYPVVLMEWVESLSLSEYIDSIITDTQALGELQSKLLELSCNLEENGIGHSNLNLQHIRIKREGNGYSLKLIDYDAMFVPPFKGKSSLSVGTLGFQHPMSLTSDYSEKTDRFSFWVFLTALEAFKKNPQLWQQASKYNYNKKENILFSFGDLSSPKHSSTFQLLRAFNNESLNFYARKLFEFCNLRSPSLIEAPQIYGQDYKPGFKGWQEAEKILPNNINAELKTKKKTHSQTVVLSTGTLAPKIKVAQKTVVTNPRLLVQEKVKNRSASFSQKNNKQLLFVIAGMIVAASTTAMYLLMQNHATSPQIQNSQNHTPTTSHKSQTVFTSEKVKGFLSSLYQAYNERDQQSILANYGPQLDQYYDADTVTREKLSGIIRDLFIKPDFYQCEPDFNTLQYREEGDNLIATITIKETIQANPGSGRESYVSKIEYTVNKSYKVISEKNIE